MIGFGLRRVPMETQYYEAYNRENVRLVDLLETPIENISEDGLKTTEEMFRLDMIVYATGFSASKCHQLPSCDTRLTESAVTGSFEAIGFRRVIGATLRDEWQHGPRTFLGITNQHLPNMFMSIGPHQAYGNIPRSIEYAVGWISECIKYLQKHDITYIEAKEEWVSVKAQTRNSRAIC